MTTPADEAAPSYTRLSVNINTDVARVLRTLVQRKGVTATEIVRRAISVLWMLDEHLVNGGDVMLVGRPGTKDTKIVLI